MSEAIKGLEPAKLWEIFSKLAKTPRESKNEAGAVKLMAHLAKKAGLETKTDAVGNLVVKVPATAGCKDMPIIVLQTHLDMVCTKNEETIFDFEKDPIKLLRKGDWIKADGTTLGADNGIGAAAAMSIATEPSLEHGPLELLYTIDEETGMTGAFGLSMDMLDGRIMINLDSEEIGAVYIGCAGGSEVETRLPLVWEPKPDSKAGALLTVKGLRGGHSGCDINLHRGNAIKLFARTMQALAGEGIDAQFADLDFGDKSNAIPREGKAWLALDINDIQKALVIINGQKGQFLAQFPTESHLKISLAEYDSPEKVVSVAQTEKIVDMLMAFPNGIWEMSGDVDKLVETSNNLAIAKFEEEDFFVHNTCRSSVSQALREVLDSLHSVSRLAGAKSMGGDAYPGWRPNPNSNILEVIKKTHQELFDKPIEVAAIHAGLECGIIGKKLGEMDMASIGPEIDNPHSPDETVSISSVEMFYKHLVAIIKSVAAGGY